MMRLEFSFACFKQQATNMEPAEASELAFHFRRKAGEEVAKLRLDTSTLKVGGASIMVARCGCDTVLCRVWSVLSRPWRQVFKAASTSM